MTEEEEDFNYLVELSEKYGKFYAWIAIAITLILGYIFNMLPRPEDWSIYFFIKFFAATCISSTVLHSIHFRLLKRRAENKETREVEMERVVLIAEPETIEIEKEINAPVYEEYQFFFDKPKQQ